mmetsp:Transcript_23466/g.68887  ORF Transcript_23466/g.68887 Transcript_23466/m.68887 type:complete len:247 (-) Transcript_23466:2004-2744(-)
MKLGGPSPRAPPSASALKNAGTLAGGRCGAGGGRKAPLPRCGADVSRGRTRRETSGSERTLRAERSPGARGCTPREAHKRTQRPSSARSSSEGGKVSRRSSAYSCSTAKAESVCPCAVLCPLRTCRSRSVSHWSRSAGMQSSHTITWSTRSFISWTRSRATQPAATGIAISSVGSKECKWACSIGSTCQGCRRNHQLRPPSRGPSRASRRRSRYRVFHGFCDRQVSVHSWPADWTALASMANLAHS